MNEPQQRDLLTKRWSKVKAPEPSEVALQIALVQHLKYRAKKDVIYFHVPNGELRDRRTAAKLKAMGTLAGVSDLVFVWLESSRSNRIDYYMGAGPRILFLELKTSKGSQSEVQEAFGYAAVGVGAYYRVANSLNQALDILQSLDLLKS